MREHRPSSLFVTAVCLLSSLVSWHGAAGAPADPSPYTFRTVSVLVEGRVERASGEPASGVAVEVINESGLIVASAESRADGSFSLGPSDLVPGPYVVRCRKGSTTTASEEIEVLPAQDQLRLLVTLRPGRRSAVVYRERTPGGPGVGAERPSPVIPQPPVTGSGDRPYEVVPIFYATDRAETSESTPAGRFASGRDPEARLHLGTCEVSIPRDHQIARVERPMSVLSVEFREDPAKHVVLLRVTPMGPDNYWNALKRRVAASPDRSSLVFVHGYNVGFAEAARRTAQLAYDLEFQGAPILYSWPAEERFWRYSVAEANVEWTTPHLRDFLARIAAQSGARAVHVVAHSMGNRAVVQALNQIALREAAAGTPLFKQVALTAPDVDAGVFAELAAQIRRTAERVTLYASDNDDALRSSAALHAFPRAGLGGEGVLVVPGVDTIDVSTVDTSLLGHSYYGDNASVVADLHRLFREGTPPDQRFGLNRVQRSGGAYWRFRPAD